MGGGIWTKLQQAAIPMNTTGRLQLAYTSKSDDTDISVRNYTSNNGLATVIKDPQERTRSDQGFPHYTLSY